MTATLLDANALIALLVAEHEHHERARAWFATVGSAAVNPIVEGAFVRTVVRLGETPATARAVLAALHEDPRIEFWSDDLSYADAPLGAVHGHRQVTDAYLAAIAASHDATLATFDRAFAEAYTVASLIPE